MSAALFAVACSSVVSAAGAIVLENAEFRLEFSPEGVAQSLLHKPTGQECLASGVRIPAFTLTQHRPYLPEQQVAYPAATTVYPATALRRETRAGGDRLIVDFGAADFEARIRVRITDAYIGFTLEEVVYKDSIKLRRVYPPGWDEVAFLRLPVHPRKNYGHWLNAAWDDEVAVNLLATDPFAKIGGVREYDWHVFTATADAELGADQVGAALVTTASARLLDRIERVEEDYDLPRGVAARRRPESRWSYYGVARSTPQQIDRHIEYARRGGFRLMQIYYLAFAKGAGHFEFRPEYPNGIDDLKAMTEKIRQAGMIPGLHVHYCKASKNDPYVRGNPDPRLNSVRTLTLNVPLAPDATTIGIDENPRGLTDEEGRRLLRIGGELVEWTSYTTTPPYRFVGCRRGALGTQAAAHAAGTRAEVLDVDNWPVFVRFDQRTSIQNEVAARIANLYSAGGFRFVHFDGAEDVPPPYWFNVAWAQWRVYRELEPKPLYATAASISHFNWHMLTRTTGFDRFSPDMVKAAARHYYSDKTRVAQDFSTTDFGWSGYSSPSSETVGTQPDILEFVAGLAAAWDSVARLMPDLAELDAHPRTPDNLEVLRRWEELRTSGRLTPEQKQMLRNPDQEHHLLINEAGEYEIVACEEITGAGAGSPDVRAFLFERSGNVYLVYWHPSGAGRLEVALPAAGIRLMERLGTALPVESRTDGVALPLDRRRYIEIRGMTRAEVIGAVQKAGVLPAEPDL